MSDYIDPYSDYSLYDVLEGDVMEGGESTEYEGFHIVAQGNGTFHVQPDGYAGQLWAFEADEYDDVLELVDDLNYDRLMFWEEYDEETRIEEAGKIMTSDKERAEENPEKYLFVPSNPEPVETE